MIWHNAESNRGTPFIFDLEISIMKIHLNSAWLITTLISACIILQACGGGNQSDHGMNNSDGLDKTGAVDNDKAEKIQEIFYAVPSPMEMASMLKKSGAAYDVHLLSDVKKVNQYTSARSQALNLGIYGADLSYASIFNQNQESIIYLSCTKKLADNLGVSKAFDETAIERMETNVENRDSLLQIISETYYMLDAYLKENSRDHISAMVIAAGWVEGLYLSTAIALKKTEVDKGLIQKIAEQKLSLNNLQELVKAYNSGGQLDDIIKDLAAIEMAYANVEVSKAVSKVSKSADGTTVIGGGSTTNISSEDLAEIGRVIKEIREKYIS